MKRYFVEQETTLKAFTDAVCAPASMCLHTLLKNREIRVNGVRTGENVPLRAGDEVCYYLTPKQEQKRGFCVVYEDQNVVVTDKESGVNTEAVLSALSESGTAFAVHRLDRNTEGLLVFARTREAERELLLCFRERRVKKSYLALVKGKPPKARSVERAYLKKDAEHATVSVNARAGEPIVTEYEVVEERGETTLLRVTLHTGKTHQIRAHLAYLGFPVVGDEKYGDPAFNRSVHASRQRLLAKELTLECGGVLQNLCGKTFVSLKNL